MGRVGSVAEYADDGDRNHDDGKAEEDVDADFLHRAHQGFAKDEDGNADD